MRTYAYDNRILTQKIDADLSPLTRRQHSKWYLGHEEQHSAMALAPALLYNLFGQAQLRPATFFRRIIHQDQGCVSRKFNLYTRFPWKAETQSYRGTPVLNSWDNRNRRRENEENKKTMALQKL